MSHSGYERNQRDDAEEWARWFRGRAKERRQTNIFIAVAFALSAIIVIDNYVHGLLKSLGI